MSDEKTPSIPELNFEGPIEIITIMQWVKDYGEGTVPQRVKARFDKLYYPEELKGKKGFSQTLKLSDECVNDMRVYKIVQDLEKEDEQQRIENKKRKERGEALVEIEDDLPELMIFHVPKYLKKYVCETCNDEYSTTFLHVDYGAAYNNILKKMELEPDKNNLQKYLKEYEYVNRCKKEMQLLNEKLKNSETESAIGPISQQFFHKFAPKGDEDF